MGLATWKQTRKRFIWREDDIGKSAEVIAATIYAIVYGHPELKEFQSISHGQLDGTMFALF